MSQWSFYDPATGQLLDWTWGEDRFLEQNTPVGAVAIEGVYDHRSQRVEFVADEEGVLKPTVVDWRPPAPVDDDQQTWSWDPSTRSYVATATLAALKSAASSSIDAVAGQARLRYITDVPGQQGVYLRKAEQAAAFKAASFEGDPPTYIAAEAAATGVSYESAAKTILAIAEQWDEVIGPAIEEARIRGKQAVANAIDSAGVAAAQSSTEAALRSI